jgi:hypothetical protein
VPQTKDSSAIPPNPPFHLRRLELPSPYDSSSSDFSSLPPNSIPPLFALSLYYTSQLYHTIDTAVQPGRKLTIWPACFCAIVLTCFFRPLQASLLAYQSPLLLEARTNVSTADFLRTFIRRPGFCWAVVPVVLYSSRADPSPPSFISGASPYLLFRAHNLLFQPCRICC